MVYSAVLFDLDGTLLDTLEDIADVSNRILASHGFPTHPTQAYRNYIGDGIAMLMSRILPERHRSQAEIDTCRKEYVAEYEQNWKVKTRAYPGIPEMLDQLTRLGIRMAVLSNKPHDLTVICIQELLSDWNFYPVFGLQEGVPRKPDPAGALQIASCLHLPAENIVYVGDTSVDMKTAVAAGMFPVGVLWGFRTEDELVSSGAKKIIKKPIKLVHLFEKVESL